MRARKRLLCSSKACRPSKLARFRYEPRASRADARDAVVFDQHGAVRDDGENAEFGSRAGDTVDRLA